MPKSGRYCWIKDRVAASNLVNNIRRALKSRNCDRALRIAHSREFGLVQKCAEYSTLERLHRRLAECYGR
jgi:hypothetical protein